ncbi:MAG: 50S ribosomal protein L6 [Acidimicrobiia bacterium]
MSRVGQAPIDLPEGVEVEVKGQIVSVSGPRGELKRELAEKITAATEDGVVTVDRADDERQTRALHGLSRALLFNMVQGVSEGFSKELSIVGVGYRCAKRGSDLELQLGFSHPVSFEAPEGIDFDVPEPTRIIVSGIDKELVGETAARIRRIRPPEPYKGKGVRYVDEYVRRKAGKAGVAPRL